MVTIFHKIDPRLAGRWLSPSAFLTNQMIGLSAILTREWVQSAIMTPKNGRKSMTDIAVGSFYRDTSGDSPTFRNRRVIRIVEVFRNGISAEVVTMITGTPSPKSRLTTMQLKTLRAGYEPWYEPTVTVGS